MSKGTNNTDAASPESELSRLETRIDELIGKCSRLDEENRSLQARQDALTQERASLIEKNELARSRVEAMIARLKSLETSS